jgi:AhpD family alkylhydroperoxidase
MTQRLDYAKLAPGGVKAILGLNTYVAQSGLPKELVDLVYLRVSQINGCAFCIDMHTRDLVKTGMTVDRLALVQVWREAGGLFSDREQAALQWAETVTRVAETGIPDADYRAVAARFSEKELVDLTFAIGVINAWNRLAIGFRVTPEGAKRAAG